MFTQPRKIPVMAAEDTDSTGKSFLKNKKPAIPTNINTDPIFAVHVYHSFFITKTKTAEEIRFTE
ncbi:hypothetical protein SDC9_62427 [bioreactor metagenome]|uniref:Uncharacterized protein n=1 Tax=bioreactor metagenome TaxID=1076179 RepID=A0A644XP74_9ZZZZ